jgi:hypothetical protein
MLHIFRHSRGHSLMRAVNSVSVPMFTRVRDPSEDARTTPATAQFLTVDHEIRTTRAPTTPPATTRERGDDELLCVRSWAVGATETIERIEFAGSTHGRCSGAGALVVSRRSRVTYGRMAN